MPPYWVWLPHLPPPQSPPQRSCCPSLPPPSCPHHGPPALLKMPLGGAGKWRQRNPAPPPLLPGSPDQAGRVQGRGSGDAFSRDTTEQEDPLFPELLPPIEAVHAVMTGPPGGACGTPGNLSEPVSSLSVGANDGASLPGSLRRLSRFMSGSTEPHKLASPGLLTVALPVTADTRSQLLERRVLGEPVHWGGARGSERGRELPEATPSSRRWGWEWAGARPGPVVQGSGLSSLSLGSEQPS